MSTIQLRTIPFLIAALLLFLSAVVSKASQTVETAQTVDRYLSIRTEMGAFSGAVLVAKKGKILLRKGYGYANIERKIPFRPETPHEVASISKMFTAMAALKLRDEGKLKLEDSICQYIDLCPNHWRAVTIHHLMRHTGGIPDYEEALGLGSTKYLELMTEPNAAFKILEDARHRPLDFTPGEKFNYSNTGYIILSYVIQKAASEPFPEYVARTLLKPAGMVNSGVLGWKKPLKDLAYGYTHDDLGWEKALGGVSLLAGHLKKVPQLSFTPPQGDAWLYSTVDDLYRWSQVMDGRQPLSPAEAAEVFTPGLDGYGYGWFIGKGFNQRRMRHNGALPGYLSDFIKFPDKGVTIIIFSNIDRAPLGHIARNISSIVLDLPYDMPVRGQVIKLTSAQTERLIGKYKTADGRILKIESASGYLTAEVKDDYKSELIPLTPTEFYFPLSDGKVVFTLSSEGLASKVNVHYSAEDHIAERVIEDHLKSE